MNIANSIMSIPNAITDGFIRHVPLIVLMTVAGPVAVGTAQAGPTLEQLFDGDSIVVDDTIFSDWVFEQDIGSKPVDLALVEVDGVEDDPGTAELDPGVKFTAAEDALTVELGDFIDFSLSFKVEPAVDKRSIVDASLELTDFVFDSSGDGVIEITDTVFDENFVSLGQLTVGLDFAGGILREEIEFMKQRMVFQEIDIFVDSGFSGAKTGIAMFEARKSQVPVPATWVLVGLGILGLHLARRHRRV